MKVRLGVILSAALLQSCAIAPNINPGEHITIRPYEAQLLDHGDYCIDRFVLDDSYHGAVVERRKIQKDQRWNCIAFDYGTTVAGFVVGKVTSYRIAEAGGNATLAVKIPAGIALHQYGENVYDDTGDDSWIEADRVHCYAGWWNVFMIGLMVVK